MFHQLKIKTFGCEFTELRDIFDTSSTIAVTGTDRTATGGTAGEPFVRISEFTAGSISSVLGVESSDRTTDILDDDITEIL